MMRIALVLIIVSVSSLSAAPTLTSLYPAGGQRGSTVEVVASGTFDTWPVQVWTDTPAITAKALKDKGKLNVAIKPDTLPGVYWLRLFDSTGASQLRPFLVGEFADVTEAEPNDDPAKAQALKGPSSVHGKLIKSGDVDCYSIAAKRGQTIVASIDAHFTLRSPIDAVLQIVAPDGAIVAENHDYRGLDPQALYTAPADGTYVVRLFAFPATPDSSIRHFGSDLSVYRLTVTTGPFIDYATPFAIKQGEPVKLQFHGWNLKETASTLDRQSLRKEPHDCYDFTTVKPTQPLTTPFTLSGRLNEREATYTFQTMKGKSLVLKLESATLGFSLNPVVIVTGPDGKQLSKSEPAKLNLDLDMNITPTTDGLHTITIRDLGQNFGPRYAYRLRVIPAGPQLDATVTSDRFTITQGKPLVIPITLLKQRFTDELDFEVVGLDKTITAKLVEPKGKADPKLMSIELTSTGTAFSGPIQIRVFSKKDPKISCFATSALTEFESTTTQLWITVPAKK